MAVWSIPNKILLPSYMFEGSIGRLSDGRQVMGYVADYILPCRRPGCLEGGDPWAGLPSRWVAIAHVFDADGHHLAAHIHRGVDPPPESADGTRSWAERDRNSAVAVDALRALFVPLKQGGWEETDILVRPFYLLIDGQRHGLACEVEGDDPTWDEEFDPQSVRLDPFGWVFCRPWDKGEYST